jgi:AAA+ ATPase superfamily predicted ATPase
MKSPFVYGKVVENISFINRAKEIERLSGNFENHINSILISPRRWGKSSLVRKTATTVNKSNPNIKFCFLDLFRIRTEEEFYKQFVTEIVKSTSGKLDEWIENVKNFLGRFSPRFSFGADPVNDFQLTFDVSSGELDAKEVLNLPEIIAKKKKIHIIVCIDEFQDVGNYKDALGFQKLLRSVWQYHQNASYCLYGSKRHMMTELFENQSMPFYKFGDVLFLQKIKKHHFIKFITGSFSRTGKSIDKILSENLIEKVDTHPYYVQQLAHIVWINTTKKVTEEILEESINELIDQNSILYQQIVNGLSYTQINFLIALSRGAINFNSTEVMQKYALGTSANVTKIKKVLINKEIVDTTNGSISFLDPTFKLWMEKTF